MLEIIILILSISLSGLLGLFVFLKNGKSATNRLFFFLTIVLILWSAANYLSVHPVWLSQLEWVRLVIFFAALLNLAVYLTFMVFPNFNFNGNKTWVIMAVAGTTGVMALSLTPYVFKDLETVNGVVQPVVAPGIGVFLFQTVALLLSAIVMVFRKFRKASGLERQQYKYVFFGVAVSFGVIVLSNFILPAFFGNTFLIPFGATFTLFFTGGIAYAIVRHRLLDIRAVVARSVAYVLLTITLGIIYGAIIFGISNMIFVSTAMGADQKFLYIELAIILAFTFQPLKGFFERLTDKFLYRDRYDSHEVLNRLGKVLVSEFKLEKLLFSTLKETCEALKINNGQFYVFNEGRIYKVGHYGPLPKKLMTVPHLRSFRRNFLIADELEGGREGALMDEFDFRLVIKLHTKNEFVGFFLLGDKLSGDIYSSQDIKLLQILCQELAVAISNAKAVEEIAEFNVTLQEKVNDATKRLRAANIHLKELDVAKDEFISMASHQLRTPLTTIKGYLSMLAEGDAGTLSAQQQDFINKAYSGSQRMVDLINDLLNVSRLQAGKFTIVKASTDLVKVLEEEVEQLQPHAKAKNLHLKLVAPKGRFPMVDMDIGKTRQVLMNLIDNAIYYTAAGSVTVILIRDEGYVQVEVSDTGIGVPEEAQKRLFGKFFRAPNAMNVRPDGTGLGLFLAKRVIEDQGGTIIFESTVGKGSTFGFRLPIKDVSARKAGRKILVKL